MDGNIAVFIYFLNRENSLCFSYGTALTEITLHPVSSTAARKRFVSTVTSAIISDCPLE